MRKITQTLLFILLANFAQAQSLKIGYAHVDFILNSMTETAEAERELQAY